MVEVHEHQTEVPAGRERAQVYQYKYGQREQEYPGVLQHGEIWNEKIKIFRVAVFI